MAQGTMPHQINNRPGQLWWPPAFSGEGYPAARIFMIDLDSNQKFTYLSCCLTHIMQQSLEKDSSYTLEFYARAKPTFGPTGISTTNPNAHTLMFMNRLDVTFTDSIERSNYGNLLYPTRETLKHQLSPAATWTGEYIGLNDWTHVKMSFIATGDEKYMHIYRDTVTDTTEFIFTNPNIQPWGGNADIIFDAFSLYKSSDTLFSVSIGNDTLLCPGEELTLTADLDDGFKLEDTLTTYLWNTGDTVPQITVTSPGTYWVEVTINDRFKARDSIVVAFEEPLVWDFPFNRTDPIERCYSDLPIMVSGPEASHDAQYTWSTGETTRTINIRDEGYYHLRVVTKCFDEEGEFFLQPVNCQIDSSVFDGNVYIPSAFTPTGRNPLWIIGGIGPNTRVEIYNRWGQRIFYSEDYLHNWWDGTFNGKLLPAGVYTYRIIAPFENREWVDRVGTVMIVR
ncbi:MAG: gliding motility-associated C-terminal domain-containing protein [Cryomorphaceae bacterium]|nr:gliding motility-associated C-terminal domain-containing protein [Cryomorphaceae bacterium]